MSISIKELVPAVREVDLGRGKAPVYSLDVGQVAKLLTQYGSRLDTFFTDEKPNVPEIIAALPEVSTQLIAMGLHAEGQEADVSSIPLASQIEILMTVWELSVPDLGNLKARLSGLMEAVKSSPAKASPLP